MEISTHTLEEIPADRYSKFYENDETPFFQRVSYSRIQEKKGVPVRRFVLLEDGEPIAFFQVFTLKIKFGIKILYIPYGPVFLTSISKERVSGLCSRLKKILKEEKAIFVRSQFSFKDKESMSEKEKPRIFSCFRSPFKDSGHAGYFQPRLVWKIDINKPDEDILSDMNSKTRYNIRKAKRGGVTVKVSRDVCKDFETFFSILKESGEKNGFSLYPKSYYREIFRETEKRSSSFLALAFYQGRPVAVNFVVLSGKTGFFLFSGVTREGRSLRSSNLLRWTAMKESKRLGMTEVNFGAVTQKSSGEWLGFSDFKRGFGGYRVSYPFFDLVDNKFLYYPYLLQRYLKNKKLI